MCTLSHHSALCELEREIDVNDVELFWIEYRKLINLEKTAWLYLLYLEQMYEKESKNTSCRKNKYTCHLRQITTIPKWKCSSNTVDW